MDEELLLRFEKLEEEHWWFVVRRHLVLDWATRYAPKPLSRVVEVGCGTGGNLQALGQLFKGAEVVGVEPVESALAVSRSRDCRVVAGSFERLPAADASVDMLVALDVIEHLEDDGVGLTEARRVLRPGGRLLLTVPAMPLLWGPHDEANAHWRRYTRPTLVAAVERAGFSVDRVSYFNTFLLPLGVVERTITRALKLKWTPGVNLPSRPVNAMMRAIFSAEIPVLRRGTLPLGMSLVLVATRSTNEGE